MTPGHKGSEQNLPGIFPGSDAVAPMSPVNPRLSANLRADYEALQNDMEQARELAADFQRQLAGKSNEFAQLKQLFEKTSIDLASLQAGIVELRNERHQLANEAMRAMAFQAKLKKVTEERDHLRVDLEFVRQALAKSAEDIAATRHERDTEFAALVIELVQLKDQLAEARRLLPPTAEARNPAVKSAASPLTPASPAARPPTETIDPFGTDAEIEISFES